MASVRKREWKTDKGEDKSAWVVAYTDQGGTRRLKTFEKKKDADRYRTQVETEIESGVHTPAKLSCTVKTASEWYLERSEARLKRGELSRTTVASHRRYSKAHILPKLGSRKLIDITVSDLQGWVDGLLYNNGPKGIGLPTLWNVISVLRETFAEAEGRGAIRFNVLKNTSLKLPKYIRGSTQIPSKETVRLLLDASVGTRMHIILHVLVFTGIRLGELRALTWGNIDFENRAIHVRTALDKQNIVKQPKTAAGSREIPLATNLARLLKGYRLTQAHNKDTDFVFSRGTNGLPSITRTFTYTSGGRF